MPPGRVSRKYQHLFDSPTSGKLAGLESTAAEKSVAVEEADDASLETQLADAATNIGDMFKNIKSGLGFGRKKKEQEEEQKRLQAQQQQLQQQQQARRQMYQQQMAQAQQQQQQQQQQSAQGQTAQGQTAAQQQQAALR